MAPTGIHSLRLYGLSPPRGVHHTSSSGSSPAPLTPPLTLACSSSDSASTAEQSYTHPTIAMPPPGPSHYEVRRTVWLTSPSSSSRPRAPPSPSASRAKLEALLSREDAVDDDEAWHAGLKNVWKGLVGGGRLRRRLPLAMVIKILMAGWLRDGTWPADAVVGPPSPLPPLDTHTYDETSRTDYHDEQDDFAMTQNQG